MKLMQTAIAGLAGALFAVAAHAADITGAGSTFAMPIYTKWAADYQQSGGAKVNYQGIGSSGGLKQIVAKTVDFAGSDAPLKDDELAKEGLFQFPTVVGGVVPVVNVPGVKAGELTLSGPVLGDIYLGKIKKWNDGAIAALNAGAKLPDADITVVRRADGSGTTFLFTNYLSKVSADWKSKVGADTAVNWPTGAGGKGNEGVSSYVQRIPNSIGYVEYAYAKQNKMAYVQMKNHDGAFVEPTDTAFKAAAAGAKWNETFYQVLTDQPGKTSWPISGATFILMHKAQDKPANATAVLKFFGWAYANGDKMADDLDYVPLPDAVKGLIAKEWNEIKDAGGKTVAAK